MMRASHGHHHSHHALDPFQFWERVCARQSAYGTFANPQSWFWGSTSEAFTALARVYA